ncbi:hypothetical protein BGX23_010968 [Mortierella sp. AD031]|nr:hypothetical protein BGX23_010968 [Mortierella sp. AD031]
MPNPPLSFFDIPELTGIVGAHLSTHDLSVCVHVSKVWQTCFAPLLWRTFPPKSSVDPQNLLFTAWLSRCWGKLRTMIEEDYQYAQQHPQGDGPDRSATELSRTGPWIRSLDVDHSRLSDHRVYQVNTGFSFGRSVPAFTLKSTLVPAAGPSIPPPTELELLLLLFKRCPNLQRLRLRGQDKHDQELWKGIASSGFPGTISDLTISIISVNSLFFSPILSTLFSRCTPELSKLDLRIMNWSLFGLGQGSPMELAQEVEEKQQEEEGPLTGLRDLSVTGRIGDSYPPSWSRFLRRCVNLKSLLVASIDQSWIQNLHACSQLRRLEILQVNTGSLQLITAVLEDGQTNIDDIVLWFSEEGVPDQKLAYMLSTCRRGWRSVRIPRLDPIAATALVKHCSTLEALELCKATGLTSMDMQRILSSSPKLHTSIALSPDDSHSQETTRILAQDFIDHNPSSGSLRPWSCESTLRVFRARISGIPREDITQTFLGNSLQEGMVVEETYPGQSQELQRRVYERLARLIRLERLELGHEDRVPGGYNNSMVVDMEAVAAYNWHHQYDCLNMSLGSGLDFLGGLKQLRMLSVLRMATSIGVEEVLWMAESWPRLEIIEGLNTDG